MTVVVSGGKPQTIKAKWPFASGNSYTWQAPTEYLVPLLHGNQYATYEEIVRSQPWIFAGIARLCLWAGRIPLQVVSGPEDDFTVERDNDLARLVRKPNPDMSWQRLMYDYVVWDFMAHGNSACYLWKPKAGAPTEEVLPIPWKFITPVKDNAERIVAYQLFLPGNEVETLSPGDIWHSRWPRGYAPLEALARTVGVEDAALEYQSASLKEGIMPRAAFGTDKVLNEKQGERVRAELKKLYGGAAEGNFAVLDAELKYLGKIGVSPADMALMEQRKLSREEACAVLDISPPFMGILDRATFNNISELRDSNYRDAVGPKVDLLAGDFQVQVVDRHPVWDGLRVMPQMDRLLRPSPEALARLELMEQQSSTTCIDDRRERRGLPPLRMKGVTDVPLLPVNMTPAGRDPQPQPSGNGDPQLSLHDELVLSVVRRNGNGDGPDDEESDE